MNIELYRNLLPLQPPELQAQAPSPEVCRRVERLRALHAYWVQHSSLLDREIVAYDKSQFAVAQTTAYEDLQALKAIIGDLHRTTADFARWRIVQQIEDDMAAAREAGDLKSLAAMQKNYIIACRLDKPDPPELRYDQIVPLQLVPTDDPSVLGIAPQKNLRRRVQALIARYAPQDADAQPIE